MLKKQNGQSLLEVLIALSVIILVVTALVRVVTISIRSSDYARNASTATAYATEAMEKIRSFRDQKTWDEFKSPTFTDHAKFFGQDTSVADYGSKNCSGTTSDFANYSALLLDGIFVRCSELVYGGTAPNDYVKATVIVSWLEYDTVTKADLPKKVEIVSYFYNWK